jgi:hypothetical protein
LAQPNHVLGTLHYMAPKQSENPMAMGGLALAPVAVGGAVRGYYANGALAWGVHPLSPAIQDSVVDQAAISPNAFFIASAVALQASSLGILESA